MNKQNIVKVVLHMGAKKKENKKGDPLIKNFEDIVEWNSDIRGTVSFCDLNDIKQKSIKFKKLIKK